MHAASSTKGSCFEPLRPPCCAIHCGRNRSNRESVPRLLRHWHSQALAAILRGGLCPSTACQNASHCLPDMEVQARVEKNRVKRQLPDVSPRRPQRSKSSGRQHAGQSEQFRWPCCWEPTEGLLRFCFGHSLFGSSACAS